MYRFCWFVLVACVLSQPAGCSSAADESSVSNQESLTDEERIQALENAALTDSDIAVKDNSSDPLNSVRAAQGSPKWPKAIINFKVDKQFYREFSSS